MQCKSLQAVTWGGDLGTLVEDSGETKGERDLEHQAGYERTAGQCHSPDSPRPCWQMESSLRGETRITRSF